MVSTRAKRSSAQARQVVESCPPENSTSAASLSVAICVYNQKSGGLPMAYDEKTAARVRKALAGRHDVVEKKLMGGLCFMVNGNMCCSVSGKGGLLVRV